MRSRMVVTGFPESVGLELMCSAEPSVGTFLRNWIGMVYWSMHCGRSTFLFSYSSVSVCILFAIPWSARGAVHFDFSAPFSEPGRGEEFSQAICASHDAIAVICMCVFPVGGTQLPGLALWEDFPANSTMLRSAFALRIVTQYVLQQLDQAIW